jgi:hypothetical protein
MDFDLAAGTAVLQRTPGCLRALPFHRRAAGVHQRP